MGYIKFIRKGTGRPFQGGQFSDQDLKSGALPGVRSCSMHDVANVAVTAPGEFNNETYLLLNFQDNVYHGVLAGLDQQGRPSFLTVEDFEGKLNWGVSVFSYSTDCEYEARKKTLEQSGYYAEDQIAEYFIAQWSLVTPPYRRGLKRFRAIYELTATYRLTTYRADGVIHLALGDSFDRTAVSTK